MRRALLAIITALALLIAGFVAFVYVQNRPLPRTDFDLPILEKALLLLEDESHWDRNGDRSCGRDAELLSLYCALHSASVELSGEFHHRAASLQAVRHAIDAVRPDNDYAHRLMDFNNSPSTSLQDVHEVLRRAATELQSATTD